MLNEANNRNLSPEGYEGGILIDEMTIQQDFTVSEFLNSIYYTMDTTFRN
jgi:hypothetical protein